MMSCSFSVQQSLIGSEYTLDVLKWLKKKEQQKSSQCQQKSPQLDMRGHLVEWTIDVAEKLGLCSETLHLAIKIVDLFMDGHDIQNPQLYLVCLGSLMIASKMEEKDGSIPRSSQLNAFVKNYFPLSEYIALEIVMLNYFKWKVCFPTACYFASLYLPYAIRPSDRHNFGPMLSFDKARAYFHVYVQFFLKVGISDITFIDVLPSLMGSCIILASRLAFGLTPRWPKSLEELTGYDADQMEKWVNVLLIHHAVTPSRGSGDEGYCSLSSSLDISQECSN